MDNTIKITHGSKWIDAQIEGDFYCPTCKSLLVVMLAGYLAGYIPYAYCPVCKKYLVPAGKETDAKS